METKKEYYWILMEKIWNDKDLTRLKPVKRTSDECFTIKHETIKEAITFSGWMEKLNNL